MKNSTSILYKLLIVILGIFALSVQIGVFDKINLKNLNYFTLISNLLCVIYYILDIFNLLLNKNNKKLKPFMPCVKGAITLSITLTMIVAQTLLSGQFPVTGMEGLSFVLLHLTIPVLVILDWLLFDKKGNFKITYPLFWTIIPIIYYLYIIIGVKLGYSFGQTSKYPYSFQDVELYGYPRVIFTDIIIAIFFIAVGYLYYFVDKKLVKTKRKK